MRLVFDACALLAYLRAEAGGDVAASLIGDPGNECHVHAINACEVYYDFLRRSDEATAQEVLVSVEQAGITITNDFDPGLWQQAGRNKAALRRISLADCFCLALASRTDAALVTADREFEQVADRGLCRVRFIR